MDGQHIGPSLGSNDRGIPLEPGQIVPHFRIGLGSVGEVREEAASACLGQFEASRCPRSPPAELAFIHHHRVEVGQGCVEKRELATLWTWHEHQSARLMLDQTLEPPALFGGELIVVATDVAQKHDIELRQFIQTGGELLDVILGTATDLVQTRMK